MPPRAVKKTAGPGPKRTPRANKKLQNQPETTEDTPEKSDAVSTPPAALKKEAVAAVEEPVVKAPENAHGVPKPVSDAEPKPVADAAPKPAPDVDPKPVADAEPKPVVDVVVAVKKEDEVKESVDEYEKGERLDLEDNDSEPEEYGTVYLGMEEEDDEVYEVEEEVEEDGDAVEEADSEEMEDGVEEIDGEEDEKTGGGGGGGGGEELAAMVHVEEEEHHEVVQERRKRKEFEIFVGGLDKDATEDDLRKVFSKVGDVVEIRLMMNAQTKKNKGFAFLRFATVEQAKRAVSELKNPVVNGKQCGVSPSQDSDTLFLGNICKTWTKEALKEKLKHYGVDNIDDLTLVEDSNNEGMNRGFAFLEFSSRSDAMDAFKLLQKRGVTFGVDRSAKVSFADSFVDPGDEIMAQVKTVFVDGLPASWDEDRIRGLLKKYGTLEKIELARNMPSAKRKDFGFVTFNSHDAAVTCAKSINNSELGDGDSKAKVRARLSRPLQRGKGKHPTHGSFRPVHASGRSVRGPWAARTLPHPMSRSLPSRGARGLGPRAPPSIDRGPKRPVGLRDRRPPLDMPVRERHLVPSSRSYERRVPAPSYARSSLKKEHSRRNEMPLRARAVADYDSKAVVERRSSYREPYAARGSGYPELPRSTSRVAARQSYLEDGYGQRFERPPLGYREGRARDYDTISGSKRSYSAMDDVPPRYTDAGARHTRPRYDYDPSDSGAHYGDDYNDRLGRSNVGYGSSRTSISSPHGLYSSRQGMSYGKGSFGAGAGDSAGVYTSSFSNDYMSRGADVGGSSYSSLYSTRSMGGSSYMGGGGSGSYY